MFFYNSVAFSVIQWMLAIWSLVPLPFHPACTFGSYWFMYCWSLAWRILTILARKWNECNCMAVWTFFGIALLWDWNENCPFPVLWPLLSFPGILHIAFPGLLHQKLSGAAVLKYWEFVKYGSRDLLGWGFATWGKHPMRRQLAGDVCWRKHAVTY